MPINYILVALLMTKIDDRYSLLFGLFTEMTVSTTEVYIIGSQIFSWVFVIAYIME